MNKHTRKDELMRPEVTTGPMRASTKVYTSPQGHEDVRVPMREIALTNPENPSFRQPARRLVGSRSHHPGWRLGCRGRGIVLVQKQLGPFVTALPVNHHSKREVTS